MIVRVSCSVASQGMASILERKLPRFNLKEASNLLLTSFSSLFASTGMGRFSAKRSKCHFQRENWRPIRDGLRPLAFAPAELRFAQSVMLRIARTEFECPAHLPGKLATHTGFEPVSPP